MRYPIAIESGTEITAFGVVVPDLPGCFSAGDTLDETLLAVESAAAAWIDATLPRRVLMRLDALATAAGQSRSSFIADLTLSDRS